MNSEHHKKNDGFDIFYETLVLYKYYFSWKKPSPTIKDVMVKPIVVRINLMEKSSLKKKAMTIRFCIEINFVK